MLFFLLSHFVCVAALMPLFSFFGKKVGLVDHPGGRKRHEGVVPLVGGLSVFTVFIVHFVFSGHVFKEYWPLYSALAALLIVGAIDDRKPLHSWLKFGVQFLAAFLVVVFGGAQIMQLGDLFGLGTFGLGGMALPFSLACVMLIINAVNLMDGLDGLAGGVSFLILLMLSGAAIMGGGDLIVLPAMALCSAIAGFLVYNVRSPLRRRASVFLGDAGSLSLGLMIAWYAILFSSSGEHLIEPIAVAWILAIPVWDECAQFYRRVREGRHPFSPDRGHFHHHFIAAGFTAGRSVFCIWCLVVLSGCIGVLGSHFGVPLPVLTVGWICGLFGHMYFSRNLEHYPRLIKGVFRLG